jgi:hypothetical protein
VSSRETHTMPGYISDKDALLARLRRIEGQFTEASGHRSAGPLLSPWLDPEHPTPPHP